MKILWKSNFSSFPQYFSPVVRFSCLGRDKIFTSRYAVIRDKRGRDNESQLYFLQPLGIFKIYFAH